MYELLLASYLMYWVTSSGLLYVPTTKILLLSYLIYWSTSSELPYVPPTEICLVSYLIIWSICSELPYVRDDFLLSFSGFLLFQIQILPLRFFFYCIFTSDFTNFHFACWPHKIISVVYWSTSSELPYVPITKICLVSYLIYWSTFNELPHIPKCLCFIQ